MFAIDLKDGDLDVDYFKYCNATFARWFQKDTILRGYIYFVYPRAPSCRRPWLPVAEILMYSRSKVLSEFQGVISPLSPCWSLGAEDPLRWDYPPVERLDDGTKRKRFDEEYEAESFLQRSRERKEQFRRRESFRLVLLKFKGQRKAWYRASLYAPDVSSPPPLLSFVQLLEQDPATRKIIQKIPLSHQQEEELSSKFMDETDKDKEKEKKEEDKDLENIIDSVAGAILPNDS